MTPLNDVVQLLFSKMSLVLSENTPPTMSPKEAANSIPLLPPF